MAESCLKRGFHCDKGCAALAMILLQGEETQITVIALQMVGVGNAGIGAAV